MEWLIPPGTQLGVVVPPDDLTVETIRTEDGFITRVTYTPPTQAVRFSTPPKENPTQGAGLKDNRR